MKEIILSLRVSEMEEYLFKYNDCYTLVKLSKEDAESKPEQYIEVPEWANYAYNNYQGVCFSKGELGSNHPLLLWQREKESIIDKLVMDEVKHSHYKKDVSHLNVIDVYRVLDLFAVEHPCIQHAVKKLLCAGQRGSKGRNQDVQEAIDSLVRFQEMRKEDEL